MGKGHIRVRTGAKGEAWEVRAYAGLNPETGKARYVTRTVRTGKRDAQRLLNHLLGEIDRGAYGGPDATMADLFERWRQASVADWSPSTAAAYEVLVRLHILPAIGAVAVRDLRTVELDALYGRLRAKGLAPASVIKVHSIIRRALSQAVRWGWVQANPADHARRPRQVKADLHPPDAHQVRALLAKAIEDRPMLAVLLELAAATGARRGELCALRWSDVDLGTATLVIGRSIVHGAKGRDREGDQDRPGPPHRPRPLDRRHPGRSPPALPGGGPGLRRPPRAPGLPVLERPGVRYAVAARLSHRTLRPPMRGGGHHRRAPA
jgi:integrase